MKTLTPKSENGPTELSVETNGSSHTAHVVVHGQTSKDVSHEKQDVFTSLHVLQHQHTSLR